MTTTWLVLVAGGLLGAGSVVAVAGLSPARPDLADAVQRLLPTQAPARSATAAQSRFDARRQELLVRSARTLGLARYASDLRMVEMTPETLAARKLSYAVVGVAFPVVMSALIALGHVRLPFAVPAAAGLVLGVILFLLPDVNLRHEATAARARMRTATCVYLELVAMERLADAGPTEALGRAAAVGGSREFARIRDALLRAELAGKPSWAGLTALAATTGVTELGDAADIMRMAGRDGAAVYSTLRARAASLRTQLLAASTAKANAASEHMVVPVALLGLCFMALLGYPAFVRILLS